VLETMLCALLLLGVPEADVRLRLTALPLPLCCAVRGALCVHACMYDEKTPTVRHGMHSTAQRWAVNTRVGFCFALLGGLDRMRVRVHRAACRAAPRPPTCVHPSKSVALCNCVRLQRRVPQPCEYS
jgi:hypothetical protein